MNSKKLSELLRLEPQETLLCGLGAQQKPFDCLAGELLKIRDQVAQSEQLASNSKSWQEEHPDNGGSQYFRLPAQILGQYLEDRHNSLLARILAKTKRLMAQVDRIVVMGTQGYCQGPRALLDACCQPFFNDLSRGQRGSRPRIYFVDQYLDNDAAQGLLHMLGADRPGRAGGLNESWGLVAISGGVDSVQDRAALIHLLDALDRSCGGVKESVRERFIPVTCTGSYVESIAKQLGCDEIFPLPEGLPGESSILSAAGLVPAALMGINVIWLLTGGKQIYENFLHSPFSENRVLQFVAMNRWIETQPQSGTRALRVWSSALASAVGWYDRLARRILGLHGPAFHCEAIANLCQPASSHTVAANGPLRPTITHNLVVENYRFDSLAISIPALEDQTQEWGQGPVVEASLPDLMSAAIHRSEQEMQSKGYPTTKLIFPRVDEYFLGQFFQMLIVATLMESWLRGWNPYGQSAAEAYKGNGDEVLGL